MPKKKYEIDDAEMEELRALSPEQKLGRIKYLENEINKTKRNIADQKAAAKDYIGEMEARRSALIDAIEQAPIAN